jgi:hypothetical protein
MTIEYKDSKRITGLSTEGKSTVTFEDDFSTDKGWTTTDSGRYSYNSSGWIDFDAQSDQTDNRISIDIGTTLSNTWVMRWKQEVTGFTQGNHAQHLSLEIGIADREVNGATSIGIIKVHHGQNSGVNYSSLGGYAVTAGMDYCSYGTNYPCNHVSGFTPSAKTNWVELKRTSSTTASLAFYTDDSYSASALDGNVVTTTMCSSPTGLRYVMLGSEYANQIPGNDRYSGKFSELKIYDGVTSVVTETQRPTDVQDNSLFVEKDTARRYWGTNKVTTEAVYTYTTTQSTNEILSGTAQAYSAERAGVELVSSTHAGKYIKVGKWNLKRVGTLGSNVFMKVEDSSGTIKGTSTGVAASGIGTSAYEDVTFTLPSPVELANGDRVYVEYTGTDGSGNYLAFGEKHPSTTPTGWEFTIYNKHNSSGGSPSGAWGDDGLPTALVPVATFDSAPASNVTSDSITWTLET